MPSSADRGPRVADLDPQSKVHLGLGIGCGSVLLAGLVLTATTASCGAHGKLPEVSASPTVEAPDGPSGYWESPDDTPSADTSDTPTPSPSATPHHRSPSPSPTPKRTKSSHKHPVWYCPLIVDGEGAVSVCRRTTAYEFGLGTVKEGHSFPLRAGEFVFKICGSKTGNEATDQTEIRTRKTNQRGWVVNSSLPKGGDCQPS